MNINRNNYEEYFLLYADNELSNAERKMVEVFVKENPEFREEFCMLKLTINIPEEEIKLEDKSFLFKNESSFFIDKNNYEEVFVHYHDNELSEKERLETETFLAQHPELKDEFELIGKAKLTPEASVIYPDKKELYRKEKTGTVITIMWWRYAVAAVLVGFGLWISIPYLSNRETETPVAAKVNEKETKTVAPLTTKVTPAESKKDNSQVASATEKEETDHVVSKSLKENSIVKESRNNKMVKSEVKMIPPSLTKNIQQLRQEPVEAVAINAPTEKVQPKVENVQKNIEPETNTSLQKSETEIQPTQAITVAYTGAPAHNDYVFYDIPAEEFRKSKVGGFFKKVKRIVERTNPVTRLLEGNDEPAVANKF